MTPANTGRTSPDAPDPLPRVGSTAADPSSRAEPKEACNPVRISGDSCVPVFKTYTQEGTLTEAECIKYLRKIGWVQIGPHELRRPRWRIRDEV